jgi:hypothetical protein
MTTFYQFVGGVCSYKFKIRKCMIFDISTFEMLNISNVDGRRKKIGGNSHVRNLTTPIPKYVYGLLALSFVL